MELTILSSGVFSGPYREILRELGMLLVKPAASVSLLVLVCLLIQLLGGISAVRGFYCLLVSTVMFGGSKLNLLSMLPLLVALLLEWIRTSERNFNTKSHSAEYHNSLKGFHFLVVTGVAAAYGLLDSTHLLLNCLVMGVAVAMLAIRIFVKTFCVWYGLLS